ncbi:fungal specific transcription factor [Colletotrichum truncatum]|uniref:Fungal specific transcription factor n=1 Tax=Colletotrichum truncatum TaxID=5467 RepID=A0ACC3ZDZ3_COLTU
MVSKRKNKEYYAVFKGRVDEPTIFSSWGDAHPRVTGCHAKFKGFDTIDKARLYLKGLGASEHKEVIKNGNIPTTPEWNSEAFYAVAYGSKPGIHAYWYGEGGAKEQTDSLKGACHKHFRTKDQAEAFVEDWKQSFSEVWQNIIKEALDQGLQLFENIVTRLAQMERLVEELQEPKQPAPAKESKKNQPLLTPEESTSSTKPSQPGRAALAAALATTSTQTSPALPPSPAASSPRTTKAYYSGAAASEDAVGTAGSCSLFSNEGIAKIDALVGDTRFSDAVRSLLQRVQAVAPQKSLDFASSIKDYPFPPNDVIISCMNEFFQHLNSGVRLLQESKVRAAVQAYMYGQPFDEPGWKLALNAILAHTLKKRDWTCGSREYEHYLNNALALIPEAILRPPNPTTIGALLLIALHFVFSAENHIAISILALATQFILLAGYHNPDHPIKATAPPDEYMHRRRLFWQAYVLDHDLMLRIGKPPLISDDFLVELPEEYPLDGYGVYYFPGNVALSYFHQQVRLSQIQGHIYSKLYSQGGSITSAAALEFEIGLLDAELQEWREGIPELIRPEPSMGLLDDEHARQMTLSVLHFMYFQMVVAIHSAAFRLPLLDEDEDGIQPSVALCVNAARAAISLLKYQRLQHPFTIYLLYQVVWSIDILFVNILEHKTSATSLHDLELIRMVLNFFESYDPNHQNVAVYHIVKALYEVASSVVLGPSGAYSQGSSPATTTISCPQALAAEIGLNSDTGTAPATLPISMLDVGGEWANLSLGGHDWLSAGYLQMRDWSLPLNPQLPLGNFEDPDGFRGNQG